MQELAHVLQHEAEHHGVEFVATFEALLSILKTQDIDLTYAVLQPLM